MLSSSLKLSFCLALSTQNGGWWQECWPGAVLEEAAMPTLTLLVNGGTTLIGMLMLGMMAYGTWRYGFFHQFDRRLGRIVMGLGLVDLAGLACWS